MEGRYWGGGTTVLNISSKSTLQEHGVREKTSMPIFASKNLMPIGLNRVRHPPPPPPPTLLLLEE